MPVEINNKTALTLKEVTDNITKAINEKFFSVYWIKAELNKLNYYKQSGHCYPELIEKKDGKIIAQMRGIIWKDKYLKINNRFKNIINEELKDGIKVLLLAKIRYSSLYGVSLEICDIDPNYTLGDLEKEKRNTIEQLKKEGIFNRNKDLPLALLPKRIAIISVTSSKGYADFLKVILEAQNKWNYVFHYKLFTALLQGDNAVNSINAQLELIRKELHDFDVVAIIRGGGGDVGLSCYNNFELAKKVATFPIPVLTGIGHSTNFTVVEMVAYFNAITPTELADFLIQKFHNFSTTVDKAKEKVVRYAKHLLNIEKYKFSNVIFVFRKNTSIVLQTNRLRLESVTKNINVNFLKTIKLHAGALKNTFDSIKNASKTLFKLKQQGFNQLIGNYQKAIKYFMYQNKTEFTSIQKSISNLDPVNVLKRGFSITRVYGKSITSVDALKEGATIDTQLYQGTITSKIIKTKK